MRRVVTAAAVGLSLALCGVAGAAPFGIWTSRKPLQGVLANGLQQPVALFGAALFGEH